MASNESTVFVVDDDETMRDSLQWLLGAVGLTVEAYGSAEQFLAGCPEDRAGCLMLDAVMPGMGGISLLSHLRTMGWLLPVIVFSGHGDVPLVLHAWRSGAFSFLQKPATHQEILDRVREALAADRKWRARQAHRAMTNELLAQLTSREQSVMDRLLEGGSNKRIAADLGISERTVEKHRERIMTKLRVRSLAALVRMVAQEPSTASERRIRGADFGSTNYPPMHGATH
jgi:FixJ family two-component response regulator